MFILMANEFSWDPRGDLKIRPKGRAWSGKPSGDVKIKTGGLQIRPKIHARTGRVPGKLKKGNILICPISDFSKLCSYLRFSRFLFPNSHA